jgi:hypothetical protein
MLELFTARYDEPTEIVTAKYQTYGGASLTGNTYYWKGNNVRIALSERGAGRKVDRGIVDVASEAFLQDRDNKRRQSIERAKDKL